MTFTVLRQFQTNPNKFGIIALVKIKNTGLKPYHIYHIGPLGSVYHYGKSYDDIIEAVLKSKEIADKYFNGYVCDENW